MESIITNFLGGGTLNIILKIVLLLGGGIFIMIFRKWMKQAEIDGARKTEQKEEVINKQEMEQTNKKENEQAKTDLQALDDLLK